ncbi:19014_t:CDS:1, partial [Racocetra persica]
QSMLNKVTKLKFNKLTTSKDCLKHVVDNNNQINKNEPNKILENTNTTNIPENTKTTKISKE